MRIFIAGATGALGRRLVPLLVERGHHVTGTTRSAAGTDRLRAAGADPVVVDALDRDAVIAAVTAAAPDVVMHQLTALSGPADLRRFDRYFAETNRLRSAGTDHLLAGAQAAGAKRIVVQSYTGWPNARSGGAVKTEDDPLDPEPPAAARTSLAAIRHLESAATAAPGLEGVVLRYGSLYGPGTAFGAGGAMLDMVAKRRLPIVGGGTGVWSHLHVEDAAQATVLATEIGAPGVYNVVDDDPAPVSEWLPYLAEVIGARPPLRVPAWLVRPVLGAQGVSLMTDIRGSSNARARRELEWTPRYPSWRQGFRHGLGR